MSAKIKTIIVEDDREEREALENLLKRYEIEVLGVATVEEARQKLRQHWEHVHVVIIDNRLGDPLITGPQVVIDISKEKGDVVSPEFIVYTEWEELEYYRYALDLGVAAYMKKGEGNPVAHVKALALRRALSPKHPKVISEVDRIAVYSKNISDALREFCRRVLKPAFDSYLGAPFVILFTEGSQTRNCACSDSVVELLTDAGPLCHTLQALAHGKGNPTRPFVLDVSKLEPPTEPEIALYRRLNGAAFLPIPLSNDMKLSIGILRPEARAQAFGSKEEEELGIALAQHLRPTVLENIISLWSLLTKFGAERKSTAKLCLRVGQEINEALTTDDVEQLEDLANDLNDTGLYLTKLDNVTRHEREDVSIKEVVNERWELISQAEEHSMMKLDVRGDCIAWVHRNDIVVIISRLLQWFAYRCQAIPLNVEPIIKVECETIQGQANITFEDNSYRLPPALRRYLFAPFTQAIATPFPIISINKDAPPQTDAEKLEQRSTNAGRYMPLYLAKMLVEGRYHGLLEDHSDEIKERMYGHRILLQLPAVNKIE